MDYRVVHEVRGHLQQERMGADGGSHVAGGFDREAAFFCEGEERFRGFLCDERKVDGLSGEGPLVGAAEQSSASVRSIARELTACRRSTSSPVSRFGSLRATSRSVCVVASGVRSSWEALAANRCCFAT